MLICSCTNNKQSREIEEFSNFMMNKKNIDITDYSKVLIISETGCSPCNMKLDLLNTDSLQNCKNLLIYCGKEGHYRRENTRLNSIYLSNNITLNIFDKFESLLLLNQDNRFSYVSIFPRNVDSVVNTFYRN